MGTVLYRMYLEYCPKVEIYCDVFVAKMEKHRLEDGGGDVDGSQPRKDCVEEHWVMVWVSTWREVLEALGRALLTVLPAECLKMCNELEDIVACWSHSWKGSWYAA